MEFRLQYHAGHRSGETNQYLFDADEFPYLQNHYHYTDDMQRMTGSAGVSYRWSRTTKFTADMIYGSGLRSGELSMALYQIPITLRPTRW